MALGLYIIFSPLVSSGTRQVNVDFWAAAPGLCLVVLGFMVFVSLWHRYALLDTHLHKDIFRVKTRVLGLVALSMVTLVLIAIVLSVLLLGGCTS